MIDIVLNICFGVLGLATCLVLIRIVRGPTTADRILGLETLSAIAASTIAVYGVHSHLSLYVDIAIALGLVSFLATAAFARYLLSVGRP